MSGHPSNLNPFLRIALNDFLASVAVFEKPEGMRSKVRNEQLTFYASGSTYITPRLMRLSCSER